MLLQEDGQLAAKLDDVMYLVDGLLKPVKTPRARLAQTRSILELVQLVQDPQILQALELSSQRRSIQNKLKLLLLRLKDTTDEMSRLSLAVLDYFDDQVLDAIVHALKQEQGGEQVEKKSTEVSDATSLKKCLKRKQNTKKSVKPETLETSTTQLDEILQGHEVFYAGDELQVSVVSTLCAALHNLMQLNGPSSSSTRVSQRCQQPDDATEDSFQRIRARKRQLLRNGGLDVLAVDLANQVYALQALLPSTSTQEISVEFFDQATFLTEEVQQYVSKQRNCFVVLLKLTQLLGELSWGVEARKRWEAELSRMALAVEVLLSALRVLLNLTHHNSEAASHVHALGGMQLLVNTFSRLWGEITAMGKHSTQKKWEFDACLLLLSVMVNSIELSEENRDALAESQVALSRDDGAMTLQAGCGLFVRFFMATLESFKHLIDVPDAQDAGGAFSVEESDDWSPEDVLLGGCTSLLLGYLMKDSTANSTAVLEAMPDGSPRLLLRSLGVFVAFHSQLGALTPEVAKSVLLIEKVLKSCEESESGTVESEVLETIAAKAVPGVREQQHADTIAAAKSQETDVDFSSTLSTEDLVKSQRSEVPPRGLRPRAMKNLCSNLDDSDEDNEQVQEEEAMLKGPQTSLEVGMRTPPRSPAESYRE
ncbi:Wings apart-like protein [Phytophthora cactorum]|nr:Wings apart-like protein [Phytophthora cactorum]